MRWVEESKYIQLSRQAWNEYIGLQAEYEHDAAELLGDDWKKLIPDIRDPKEFEGFWSKWMEQEEKKL
jgi:hypothetical protein